MAILNLHSEVLPWLGLATTAADAHRGLLQMIVSQVERDVIRFLGYDPTSQSYTHYLPRRQRTGDRPTRSNPYDVQGTRVVTEWAGVPHEARHLYLLGVPVTAVSAVYEDLNAYGGQASGDFGSSSLLTAGSDYYIDQDTDDWCTSGRLVRIGSAWPARPLTVKAQYTAGYTQDQLTTGAAAPIKEALLDAVQLRFAERGVSVGSIQSEKLGAYAVTYARSDKPGRLPLACKRKLMPFVHLAGRLH